MTINNVNNVPSYATECPVWVANLIDDQLWFWGAYDDAESAYSAASQIGGQVVYNA